MSYALGVSSDGVRIRASVRYPGGAPGGPVRLGERRESATALLLVDDEGYLVVGDEVDRLAPRAPDRVLSGVLDRVGDGVPMIVGGMALRPEALAATVCQWVVECAAAQQGAQPEWIGVTHPADWGRYRSGLLDRGLSGFGLHEVTHLPRPVATVRGLAPPSAHGVFVLCSVEQDGATISVVDLDAGEGADALLEHLCPADPSPTGLLAEVLELRRAGTVPRQWNAVLVHGPRALAGPVMELFIRSLPCPVRLECEGEFADADGAALAALAALAEPAEPVDLAEAQAVELENGAMPTTLLTQVETPDLGERPGRPVVEIEPFPVPPRRSLRPRSWRIPALVALVLLVAAAVAALVFFSGDAGAATARPGSALAVSRVEGGVAGC